MDTLTHRTITWTFTESRPRKFVGLVESIWHFEGAVPHTRERHFPNGLIDLVIQLGPRFRFVRGEAGERCATTSLAGLQTGSIIIEAPPGQVCVLGVRFYPAGAYAVLDRPLNDASERVVNLEDIVGHAARELAERCGDILDPGLRLACTMRWISERLARSQGIDPRVAWVAARIEVSHGNASIARLQHHTGLSKDRLVAVFREQIGLAPKRYARVMRFRHALSLLHEGGHSLAEVAAATGYHDQPHMNREFRELGGLTPGEFLGMTRYSATTALG